MSYDIYFVRRDPGQTFEDALDDLESSFENGDPGELTDVDLEHWEALLPQAREILGDIEVDESDEETRELTATASGIELRLITGEVEIHVPERHIAGDDVGLMSTVYELARAVEDVTGLEGFDPQLGEPVSDQPNAGAPSRRWWSEADEDDDADGDVGDLSSSSARVLVGDMRPEMAPDVPGPKRHWWEFWKP